MRVAKESVSAKVAGAITGVIRDMGTCDIEAIGALAVYRAVNAMCAAEMFLASEGVQIKTNFIHERVNTDGEEHLLIRFHSEVIHEGQERRSE